MVTLYHSTLNLESDSCDNLPDSERKHLRTLRARPGDSIRLVDGKGAARIGLLKQFDFNSCIIGELQPTTSNEPAYERILVLGKVSQPRLEWAVEALTPLGLTKLIVLDAEFSQPSTIRTERLERIAETAMKQCHRARLPLIETGHKQYGVPWSELIAVINNLPEEVVRILGEPDSTEPIASLHLLPATDTIVAIGPEGAFSANEIENFRRMQFRELSLGKCILRSELAAVIVFAHLL